jgi:hypothetical protein
VRVTTTVISGFRREVDEICTLLGCYHSTLRNIPEQRRSQYKNKNYTMIYDIIQRIGIFTRVTREQAHNNGCGPLP